MPNVRSSSADGRPERPLRVLLVDDMHADRELAREAFGQAENVTLDTCASAQRALDFLHQPTTTLPDVILIDLNMPGMSGLEMLSVLKGDPQLGLIPAAILTTSESAQDVEQAYTLHASSYMVKQHNFGTFVRQVEAFVGYWLKARTTAWPS